MTTFASLAELRAACLDLPLGHPAASAAVANREAQLTKPPRSLGRLEDLTAWLAHWQGRNPPRLDDVEVLVFAGNHGVSGQGVSAYPAEVTVQMVANFSSGGAAINQLARTAGAALRVIPIALETPTADFTQAAAMTEREFLDAVATGYDAVRPQTDLLCLGEMGIGNTTAAAAIAAALFGGGGTRWAGRGTGVDDARLAHKRVVIDQALATPSSVLNDPLRVAARSAGVSLPRSWVRRLPRASCAFRWCSTVLSAPPRWPRFQTAHRHARPRRRRPRVRRGGASRVARYARLAAAPQSRHAAR